MSNQVGPMPAGGADSSPPVTKETAKMLMQREAEANCCYGKEPARDLQVNEIRTVYVTVYELLTCTESRKVKICEQAYAGQPIQMGMPKPGMWDIQVPRPNNFVSGKNKVEVPNSSMIKSCGHCDGTGMAKCSHCGGTAFARCPVCHGDHFTDEGQVCPACIGIGRVPCQQCTGGRKRCHKCDGSGKVRVYEKLVVKWHVHEGNFAVKGNSSFPSSLLVSAPGVIVFTDTQPKLAPLTNYPIAEVNSASAHLLHAHESTAASTGIIIQQRHFVKNVKLTECDYQWKDFRGTFFVYGSDNRVFAPDYPHNCCCCHCKVL